MALIRPPFRPTGLVRAAGQQAPASGLAAFYTFADTSDAWRDSVTGLKGTTNAGQTRVLTPYGPGLQYNGSARVVYTNFQNPASVATEFLTVVACAKVTTLPGGNACVVTYGTTGSGRAAICGFNSSGFAMCGAITSAGVIAVNDATNHLGEWVVIAGSGQGSQGAGFGWLNGKNLGSNFGGSGTGTPTRINIGRDDTNYFSAFTGQVAWVAAFNRILSDAEHMAIVRDPYGFCLGSLAQRRIFFGTAGGNVYNESVSESMTAAEVVSAIGTFPRTIAETVTPTDIYSQGAVINDSIAESASPADTISNVAVFPRTISESAPIAEVVNAQNNTFNVSIAESGSANNTQAATGIFPRTISESGSAVDTVAASAAFVANLSEIMSAANVQAALVVYPVSIAESAPITDVQSSAIPGGTDIIETMNITDVYSATVIYATSIAESMTATNTQAAALIMPAAIAETATPTDAYSAIGIFVRSIAEGAGASDFYVCASQLTAAIAESMAADDVYVADEIVRRATACNTLSGAPRVRRLEGAPRVRTLGGRSCE